jgi:curved DNA-binding protein CbpA
MGNQESAPKNNKIIRKQRNDNNIQQNYQQPQQQNYNTQQYLQQKYSQPLQQQNYNSQQNYNTQQNYNSQQYSQQAQQHYQQPQQYSQQPHQYSQQPQQNYNTQQYYQQPQQYSQKSQQNYNSQQYYQQQSQTLQQSSVKSRLENQNANNNLIANRNLLNTPYNSNNNPPPIMPYPESTQLVQKYNLNAELNPYNFTEEVDKFKNELDNEKTKFNEEEMKKRAEFDRNMEKKNEYLSSQIKNFEEKYNPYKILGLNNDDNNLINIKKAYKKMALKYHPDKVGDKYNNEFQLVTQSYVYLLNKSEKMSEIKNKTSKKVEFVEYADDINESVENIYVSKDKFDLNTFNKIFEKYKLPDASDDGYGELYKEKIDEKSPAENEIFGKKFNKEVFNSQFDNIKSKKASTDIIEYNEPEALYSSSGSGFTELGLNKVNDFSANNLSYTDYRKAHVDETLLIDTSKVNFKTYNSVEQLENDRSKISYKPNQEEILRNSNLDRMKKQKEDERLKYLQDRDDVINNHYKKINNKLIVHK